ncbi:hypothetical protein GCM10023191_060920 [Actinoallomurus oryzae]|uniref:WXG100 family type VII secretion target n=1 Tax=Actinoallomurus oryzae TaxID=502180 RepID=A0ABP8QKX6_9ACTN
MGDEPMGDAAKYQSHEIVDFANSVDPGTVQQLGATYEGIAKNFGDSLQSSQKNAQRLSEAWKGEGASQEACRQLALLYVAALTMQINANQIGGVLKNLGSDKPDFSKTTFLYGGAYGIPEVTSIENNDGACGRTRRCRWRSSSTW